MMMFRAECPSTVDSLERSVKEALYPSARGLSWATWLNLFIAPGPGATIGPQWGSEDRNAVVLITRLA